MVMYFWYWIMFFLVLEVYIYTEKIKVGKNECMRKSGTAKTLVHNEFREV